MLHIPIQTENPKQFRLVFDSLFETKASNTGSSQLIHTSKLDTKNVKTYTILICEDQFIKSYINAPIRYIGHYQSEQ